MKQSIAGGCLATPHSVATAVLVSEGDYDGLVAMVEFDSNRGSAGRSVAWWSTPLPFRTLPHRRKPAEPAAFSGGQLQRIAARGREVPELRERGQGHPVACHFAELDASLAALVRPAQVR